MASLVEGLFKEVMTHRFNPSRITIGTPYKITFEEPIEIFGNSYKTGEAIWAIPYDIDEYSIKLVYVPIYGEIQRFELTLNMGFIIEEAE